MPMEILIQTLRCIGNLLIFLAICLIVLIPARKLLKIPSFVFRKVLHIVAFSCVSLMILFAGKWVAAALCALLIAAAAYPALAVLEHLPWFEKFFVQKSAGEIKRSCLLLFFMFALLIAVSWGVFGQPRLAVASILMWGTGDAAAALVGIPLGKHKVKLPLTDGKKSWEGTAAMFGTSFAVGLAVLLLAQNFSVPHASVAAAAGALIAAATELFSPSEYDTVTVPLAVITVLLIIAR